MTYEERMQNVAVLGVGNKTGRSLVLLTAIQMADLSLKPEFLDRVFILNAIDQSDKELVSLMDFLRIQVRKIAEKRIVQLRKVYVQRTDLVENGDIINDYIRCVINIVRPSAFYKSAHNSSFIIEALDTDWSTKVSIMSNINTKAPDPLFLTLDRQGLISQEYNSLMSRMMEYGFYSPPEINHLIELSVSDTTAMVWREFALQFTDSFKGTNAFYWNGIF